MIGERSEPTGSWTKEERVPVEVWPLDERSDYGGHVIAWGYIDDGPAAAVLHVTPFTSVKWHQEAAMVRRVLP